MDVKDVKRIEEQTKRLLEKFSLALAAVKTSGGEWNVERKEDRRKEKEGKNCDNDFRQIMLNNAPTHDDEFIFAEKKNW